MEKAKKGGSRGRPEGVFAKAGSVVVAHYSGMTVAQMSDLARRACARTAPRSMWPRTVWPCARWKERRPQASPHLFKGPTGIAVSKDPVAASKVAAAYAKENDKLVILGGWSERRLSMRTA